MTNVHEQSEPVAMSIDEAAEAILGQWSDGENLSDDETETATTSQDDETVQEVALDDPATEEEASIEADSDEEDTEYSDQDEDTDEADDEAIEIVAADDDDVVEITVNGEMHQTSVKELKRLYGQEKSLTQKSQDLASQRKQSEQEFARTQMAYQKMIERAEARYKPYQEIDMLVASRQMDSETFAQLRADAKQAEDDVRFLREESASLLSEAHEKHQQALQTAAQECVRVLEAELPDWSSELYQDIRTYAVSAGLPQEQVDQYVDPAVIMLINKARLYDQSQATVEGKKAKLTKTRRGKKNVLSSKKAPPAKRTAKAERIARAQKTLAQNPRNGGDLDDVAELLLARWQE